MKLEGPSQPNTLDKKQDAENSHTYNLESGAKIKINAREFYPENSNKEIDSGKAVILLPGWEAEPKDKTTMSLGYEFAKHSNQKTYAVTAEIDKNSIQDKQGVDVFYEESMGVSKFIKDNNIKEVKLVGYSIGGDKAMSLGYILQNDTNIKLDGIILLSSTGLYEQNPRELVSSLLKDSFIKTPKKITDQNGSVDNFKKWFGVAKDVNLNTVSKTIKSPSHIGEMLKRIKETSRLNKYASELNVPIVLINGKDDLVSNEQKIVPSEGTEKNQNKREELLKENLFKNSPYVRMVVADKLSNHGLPYFRSESVAATSLFLLDRFKKEDK